MTKRKTATPLADELAVLQSELAALRHADRLAGLAEQRRVKDLDSVRWELGDARARVLVGDGDEQEVVRLAARMEELSAAGSDEMYVTRRAIVLKDQAVRRFVTDNYGGLLDELAPQAVAAADRLSAALREPLEAHREYEGVAGRVDLVMRLADVRDVHLPVFDMSAVRSVLRDAGDVPVPLPRAPVLASIALADDPDPVARERARAKAGGSTAAGESWLASIGPDNEAGGS